MKKIIFSCAAALLAMVGLSAFRAGRNTLTSYYWFFVKENYGDRASFASTSQLENILTSSGSELFGTVSIVPSTEYCSGDGEFNCIVGFTASQLTAGRNAIIVNGSLRSQTIQTVACKRSVM